MIETKELLIHELNQPANIVGCVWSSFDAFELLEKYDLLAYTNNDVTKYTNTINNLLKDKKYIDDVAAFVAAYIHQLIKLNNAANITHVENMLKDHQYIDKLAKKKNEILDINYTYKQIEKDIEKRLSTHYNIDDKITIKESERIKNRKDGKYCICLSSEKINKGYDYIYRLDNTQSKKLFKRLPFFHYYNYKTQIYEMPINIYDTYYEVSSIYEIKETLDKVNFYRNL